MSNETNSTTQGVLAGGQIGGYTDEHREANRAQSNRYTALHLAQKNNEGNDATEIVKQAEIFFAFLNQ